jgi:hypothetical protein
VDHNVTPKVSVHASCLLQMQYTLFCSFEVFVPVKTRVVVLCIMTQVTGLTALPLSLGLKRLHPEGGGCMFFTITRTPYRCLLH